MDVKNPRHVLAVSLDTDSDHLCRALKDLTGAAPEQPAASLAGTTHNLPLKTAYYTATVPIWIDLIVSPAEWATSFLSDGAREVLNVLGGLVLVFPLPVRTPASAVLASAPPADADATFPDESSTVASASAFASAPAESETEQQLRNLIRHVGRVVKDGLGGWSWDGVGLAVGIGESDTELWDELCAEAGLEFVQVTSGKDTGRNEFGEKMGIARVQEALESNDWAQLDGDALSDFGDFEEPDAESDGKEEDKDLDPENLDFGFDRADFEGLKRAIWTGGGDGQDPEAEAEKERMKPSTSGAENTQSKDTPPSSQSQGAKAAGETAAAGDILEEDPTLDDDEIAKVETMMRKLQAVREAGEGMGQEQRRRMAARAVEEVMREL